MSSLELTSFITLLANAIANSVSDDDVINLLSVIFSQLGDTLATITTNHALLDKLTESSNNFRSFNSH